MRFFHFCGILALSAGSIEGSGAEGKGLKPMSTSGILTPTQLATSGVNFLLFQVKRRLPPEHAAMLDASESFERLVTKINTADILVGERHPFGIYLDCDYETACGAIRIEPRGREAVLFGFWPPPQPPSKIVIASMWQAIRGGQDDYLQRHARELNGAWTRLVIQLAELRSQNARVKARRA